MISKKSVEYLRLKDIMSTDKVSKPANFEEVLKSELYSVLKNYFETESDQIKLQCDLEDKCVVLRVEVKACSVKPFLSLESTSV